MEKGIFINSHRITKEVPWRSDNYFGDIWVKDIEKDTLIFCAPCDSCFDRFKPGKLAFDEDGNIIIKGV